MDSECTSRTTDSRLLRFVEVLPGSGLASQPGLHFDGDEDIADGGDQVDLVVSDSNVTIANGGASPLEKSSGQELAGLSDRQARR